MQDEFQAFFESPTAAHYRLVREAILNEPNFQPHTLEMTELARCCQQGRYELVRERIEHLLPEWALSPRLHFFAARAAWELADPDDAELERFLLSACLQGLLATGNGGPARPYLITYPTDPYDILQARGLQGRRQTLVESPRGRFDVITCEEGGEVWFDVTDLLRYPSRQVGQPWDYSNTMFLVSSPRTDSSRH